MMNQVYYLPWNTICWKLICFCTDTPSSFQHTILVIKFQIPNDAAVQIIQVYQWKVQTMDVTTIVVSHRCESFDGDGRDPEKSFDGDGRDPEKS
jgi:hypothetical protein